MGALAIVVVVGTARVYVGWSWPSEAVASTLLGGLWVLVFMVAWHTRDRVRTRHPVTDEEPARVTAGGVNHPVPGGMLERSGVLHRYAARLGVVTPATPLFTAGFVTVIV